MDIKETRERTGLSQAGFAKLMGSNQQRISEFEGGKRRLTGCHRQLLAAINKLLDKGVDISFFNKRG